jgi:hypothetical protein
MDIIAALRRHATNDLVTEDLDVSGPETKEKLLRLKKEREKQRAEAADGTE